jgi:hypothetical protein
LAGPSGLAFCNAALDAKHRLTLFVRNPSKVPQAIAQNTNAGIIEGGFDDMVALEAAAKCGADIFVSFIGPISGHKGTVSRSNHGHYYRTNMFQLTCSSASNRRLQTPPSTSRQQQLQARHDPWDTIMGLI